MTDESMPVFGAPAPPSDGDVHGSDQGARGGRHQGRYQGYVYAYPHKTAYRPLNPRPSLREVWSAEERRDALFLYLHVPFCEMRCGFCNLFTRTGASDELTGAYLDALERQALAVREALHAADATRTGATRTGATHFDAAGIGAAAADTRGTGPRFATAAFGGGTPTYLTAGELARLCDIAEHFTDLRTIPFAVETSPATATADRLRVLVERGATRISIGVQSFLDHEAHAVGRPQRRADVEAALDRIRATGVPTLNIDLIYGIDGQTPASWLRSLNAALRWEPEELYLYPLYVRPLTGLGRRGAAVPRGDDDPRVMLYEIGRQTLLDRGYEQVSMRMFQRRRDGTAGAADGAPVDGAAGADSATDGPGAVPAPPGPVYCCQTDGMVGLGVGARSYTSTLHYSFEYAVAVPRVRGIIDDYLRESDFGVAHVGFVLDDEDRRRRYLIQSLLQVAGLDRAAYVRTFGSDALADFPELAGFADRGWLVDDSAVVRLTAEGLAHSDVIGPSLFSARVRTLMETYEAR